MYTTYHITDLATFDAHVGLFREAHWVPCKGKILCSCVCLDDDTYHQWVATPGVTSLPDPLRNQVVGATLATALSDFQVAPTDTTLDVSDRLKNINPAFRFDFR